MKPAPDIFEAVRAGDLDAVTRITDADPSAARERDERGLTPLMHAVYAGHGEIVAVLLAHAARDLDIFEAAATGHELRITELVEVDPGCVRSFSPDGFTPLHLAAYFAQEGPVRLLLDYGADPNAVAQNDMRVQPLHSAVSARQCTIAGLLIAAGAEVNTPQQAGFTPLHGAAHNGDSSMIELLLASGADPNARSDDGKTPLDLAREQGHQEGAALLVEVTG
jgi:ankyrin repeat protein